MTATRDSDRILRAWLDLMPDEAPDRAIDAVLDAVEVTPQRRPLLAAAWRPPTMSKFAFTGALVAFVVIAGAVTLLPHSNPGVASSPIPAVSASAAPAATSSPPPAATSSASAATDSPPPALMATWVGAPRDVPEIAGSARSIWKIRSTVAELSGASGSGRAMSASISVTGDTIRLTDTTTLGCSPTDEGRYTWALSPIGSRLHVERVADPCAARATAFSGDWYRIACKAANTCFGDVDAGTYPTTNWGAGLRPDDPPESVFGAATYTLPEGWAVAGDHTTDLRLVRSADYARENADGPPDGKMNGIEAWIRPAALTQTDACDGGPSTSVPRTANGLTSWLASLPSLETTRPIDVTIDGHPGRQLDIRIAPSWNVTCGFPAPTVIFLTEAVGAGGPIGSDPYAVGLTDPTRLRLTALDLGGGRTAVLIIRADDPAAFDATVQAATPIIKSFRFH